MIRYIEEKEINLKNAHPRKKIQKAMHDLGRIKKALGKYQNLEQQCAEIQFVIFDLEEVQEIIGKLQKTVMKMNNYEYGYEHAIKK